MKNSNAITLLFTANIISGLAQGISMIAIPWYFVEIVDNQNYFRNSYLIITFLTLFWGLYAGTIIDRYSRKKIFIILNLICGTFIGLIAIYGIYYQNISNILVILVFMLTIFNYNVHYPNLYALGQEITERKYYGKLNSYIEVQGQVTSVLAGAFAAILLTGTNNGELSLAGITFNLPFDIKAWNIYDIFLMDAITYLVVIIIFSYLKYQPIVEKNINKENLLSRFQQGLNFLKSNKLIFIFGICSYMLFAFTLVEIHIVLPSYVHNFLQKSGEIYASAEIYYSFGAIFSGILIIRIFRRFKILTSVIILFIMVIIMLYFMSIYKLIWIFFIGNFIIGITNAGVRILRTTYLFNNVPNNLIGRVNSVFNSLNIIVRLFLIGILSFSFFDIEDNIRYAYLVGVFLLFISLVILLFYYRKIITKSE
tara:strand:+ start:148594 stop:149865 length:1272 start_codon:yes stop_codon:yes gene_type:complete